MYAAASLQLMNEIKRHTSIVMVIKSAENIIIKIWKSSRIELENIQPHNTLCVIM